MLRFGFAWIVILLLLAPLVAGQEPGTVIAKPALIGELPINADHPLPRRIIAVREEVISSQPVDQTILVVHHRASPEPDSLNDDQVVIALKTGNEYKVLDRLQSDAGCGCDD